MLAARLKAPLVLVAATAPIAVSLATASAANVYWDINGDVAGAGGPTPTGLFAGANWNPVADGTGTPVAFVSGGSAGSGDVPTFAAGGDATGAYTVTLASTVNAAGILVEEGDVTLAPTGSAGAIALGTTGGVTVAAGAVLSTDSSARVSFATGSTGVYTLNGGTLRTTNATSAGSFVDVDAGVVLGANGGTFDYPVANVLNIFGQPVAAPTATSGKITGTGGLTKTGVGVIAISTAATYGGATVIDAGEIRLRNNVSNVLPIGTALTINANGVLNLNQNVNQTVASLSGSGLVGAASGNFIVNGSASTTFSGSIRDIANAGASGASLTGGRFTKNGTSTLTLTGNNTFTGATTVGNGTLLLANASGQAISGSTSIVVNNATSSVVLGANEQINNAATLTLNLGTFSSGGFSETLGPLLVNGSGSSVIDFGTSAGSTITFGESSALSWAAGATLKVYNWTGLPNVGGGLDQFFVSNTGTSLSAAQIAKITFYADNGLTQIGTGATLLSNGELVANVVPEPAALAALAGVSLIGLVRRRRA